MATLAGKTFTEIYPKLLQDPGDGTIQKSDGTAGATAKANLAGGNSFTGLQRLVNGLNFNASGGDTLSNYEEIDFSGTIEIADAGVGGNLASMTVDYARGWEVGKYFFYEIGLRNIDTSGMTGAESVRVRGFPKVAKTGNVYRPTVYASLISIAHSGVPALQFTDNLARASLVNHDNGTQSLILVSDITSGSSTIRSHGFYQIN